MHNVSPDPSVPLHRGEKPSPLDLIVINEIQCLSLTSEVQTKTAMFACTALHTCTGQIPSHVLSILLQSTLWSPWHQAGPILEPRRIPDYRRGEA
jgi:hypothetical protein